VAMPHLLLRVDAVDLRTTTFLRQSVCVLD
jgi:hypothetical protein